MRGGRYKTIPSPALPGHLSLRGEARQTEKCSVATKEQFIRKPRLALGKELSAEAD